MAAVAAITEVAVAEARDETEQSLRGSLLEELLRRDDLDPADVVRRAARMGCDLSEGAVGLCADPGERSAGRLIAVISDERSDALAQAIGARVYALLPGSLDDARRVATRLGRQAVVGVSSRYADPAELRRALEEAELVLDVTADGHAPEEDIGGGTYRLLFRVLASHPEEVRSFYEDTVAPVVRYDEQYSTDLVGTLEAYLAENCNMNATASAIYAHRHTVAYRLERVRDLTGLNPMASEDRERLGLGLKAYRIIAPRLPR
jgi:DNA-binding PucR family transcriptional regulator